MYNRTSKSTSKQNVGEGSEKHKSRNIPWNLMTISLKQVEIVIGKHIGTSQ